MNIDLHCGLRHLDTVLWEDLFDNAKLADLCGTKIRILRPEDHLRVLCVHWLNDGAENRQRLWDIYFAIENRPKDFDWDRFLYAVDKKRTGWLLCAIGLARRYLDLNVEDTPLKAIPVELPEWLSEAVEKSWKEETFLVPLHNILQDPGRLFSQILRRIPPNPIQATIESEGKFDSNSRLKYQVRNTFWRLKPSIRRIFQTIKNNG